MCCLAVCYPQLLYLAGIDTNKLEIVMSNAMVDEGGRIRGGENAGDTAREQQIAMESAIFEAVKKHSKNKGGNVDPRGMEKKDDLGMRDRVEDLISSSVGLKHIKCQVSFPK